MKQLIVIGIFGVMMMGCEGTGGDGCYEDSDTGEDWYTWCNNAGVIMQGNCTEMDEPSQDQIDVCYELTNRARCYCVEFYGYSTDGLLCD